MPAFDASVQYGDWEGTSATDDAGTADLHEYLKSKGLIKPDEFLIASELWVGENHGTKLGYISARAFLFAKDGNFETVKAALAATDDPIPVRIVDLKIGLPEFVLLFKRFAVVLTRRGLDLNSREYKE